MWIESNDAEVGLSEIRQSQTEIHVPVHIYEDCLVDEDLKEINIGKDYVTYAKEDFFLVQKYRENAYRACKWYLEGKIPTAKSVLLPWNEARSALEQNLKNFPFVKTCSMSPKDVCKSCVFGNVEDTVEALITSERTKNLPCHIFMREVQEIHDEARCFWSRGKLTAVSLQNTNYETETEILDFFEKYGDEIPYNSAVVDIGFVNGKYQLIEFNTFGPDMKATAGNFSWREDIYQLLIGEKVEFRSVEN